jgi:hypothetical protein
MRAFANDYLNTLEQKASMLSKTIQSYKVLTPDASKELTKQMFTETLEMSGISVYMLLSSRTDITATRRTDIPSTHIARKPAILSMRITVTPIIRTENSILRQRISAAGSLRAVRLDAHERRGDLADPISSPNSTAKANSSASQTATSKSTRSTA